MQTKRVGHLHLIRLETGEEVIGSLKQFADAYRIGFATVQAIGALSSVTLGYYDPESASYQYREIDSPVEVVQLGGTIAKDDAGERIIHAHIAVGQSDNTVLGGHLVEGVVGPTLEVTVQAVPATVRRRLDPQTDLKLWDLNPFDSLSI